MLPTNWLCFKFLEISMCSKCVSQVPTGGYLKACFCDPQTLSTATCRSKSDYKVEARVRSLRLSVSARSFCSSKLVAGVGAHAASLFVYVNARTASFSHSQIRTFPFVLPAISCCEVGIVHVSGVSCLISDPKLQRGPRGPHGLLWVLWELHSQKSSSCVQRSTVLHWNVFRVFVSQTARFCAKIKLCSRRWDM